MTDDLQHLLIQQLNQHSQSGSGPCLWIVDENLPVAELGGLRPAADLQVLTNRADVSQRLEAAGHRVKLNDFDFSSWEPGSFASVVYRVSKERAVVYHCINQAFDLLRAGGSLLLLGGKQDGVKTNARHAGEVFGSKAKNNKHGKHYVLEVRKPEGRTSAAQVLDSNDYPSLRRCHSAGMDFLSKPGIFGWNKVDRGSSLLIGQLFASVQPEQAEKMDVLDLGCGYGYLLLASAALPFRSRAAMDNNAAAITAAAANFAERDMQVSLSLDDCAKALAGPYQLILCNPPFHQGFGASRELSDKFLLAIQRLLDRRGLALLVVNEFIPLERLASEYFAGIETLCSQDGFKVVALQQAKRR